MYGHRQLDGCLPCEHDNRSPGRFPGAMAGCGFGQIETGHVLDITRRINRQTCRRYLPMMVQTGVRLDPFGDAIERLTVVRWSDKNFVRRWRIPSGVALGARVPWGTFVFRLERLALGSHTQARE